MIHITELHRKAMAVAEEAMVCSLRGNAEQALELYAQAFRLEREAAAEARRTELAEPSLSILHRSAATLALDAKQFRDAEKLIAVALSMEPPEEIAGELRDLLEQVNFGRHLSLRGVELHQGEFQFAIVGPAVGFGIAPSSEFVRRIDKVETLLYRTAERKLRRPYRDHGQRSQALQKEVEIFVTVPRAASFAVTFRIGSNEQIPLFEGTTFGDELVDEVLTCFEMLNRGQDRAIQERIADDAYHRNFVALAAQIAPDGERITGIGLTGAEGQRRVQLMRSKESVEAAIAPIEKQSATPADTVTGVLGFASSLEAQSEIRLKGDDGHIYRVLVPEGLMNDIVKPLWGERVEVRGKINRGRKFLLHTIKPIG